MTSWQNANMGRMKKVERELALTYETNTVDSFCSQFNNYFYSCITAKNRERKLYVYDKSNIISPTYSLINSTFVCPSNVEMSDVQRLQFSKLDLNQTFPITRLVPANVLSEEASKIFEFNPAMLEECNTFLNGFEFPSTFDIGIHIRSNNVRRDGSLIPIENYVAAVKQYIATLPVEPIVVKDTVKPVVVKSANKANKADKTDKTDKVPLTLDIDDDGNKPEISKESQDKPKPREYNIFIMTDSYKLALQFKEKCDPKWNFFTMCSPDQKGYTLSDYKQLPLASRKKEYVKFVTELMIMRNLNAKVCNLSTCTGRWLYLTKKPNTYFKSLDIQAYTTT
jgi:hypothetical protein